MNSEQDCTFLKEGYLPSADFLCQECGANYIYGMSNSIRPATFCSRKCGDAYISRHHRLPPVTAEIPLGPPQRCNLSTIGLAEYLDSRNAEDAD